MFFVIISETSYLKGQDPYLKTFLYSVNYTDIFVIVLIEKQFDEVWHQWMRIIYQL